MDITPLEKWNVSNGINFKGMFCGCSSLKGIKGLRYWIVSKGEEFETMFFWMHLFNRYNSFKKLECI